MRQKANASVKKNDDNDEEEKENNKIKWEVWESAVAAKKISALQPKGITCNEVSELVSVAENKSAVLLYSYWK